MLLQLLHLLLILGSSLCILSQHLVEQLLGVVIEGFMGKHAFVVVDTLPSGVKQLAGEFTMHVWTVVGTSAKPGDVELAQLLLFGQLDVMAEVTVVTPGTSPLNVVLADGLSFLILVLVVVIPPSEPSPFMASTSIPIVHVSVVVIIHHHVASSSSSIAAPSSSHHAPSSFTPPSPTATFDSSPSVF